MKEEIDWEKEILESENSNRRHLKNLVKAQYPADKVYFQSVRQK